MLSALPTVPATTAAATPSTRTWLLLSGLLTCLLVVGHHMPATRTPAPTSATSRASAPAAAPLLATPPVAAPASSRHYASTQAVAASAAL